MSSNAGERLRASKPRVLALWEERVRREIPSAHDEPHPILIDTLPLLIDLFVEALLPDSSRVLAGDGTTACQEHGGERARVTRYSLDELIHEYQILRDVLFAVLDEGPRPLTERERTILWKSLDDVLKQSATAYSLVQQLIRQQFFMTLSHDLRSPLTAARTSAQLILRYVDKPEQHARLAAKVVDSIDRADRMITDLLDANRVRAGERLTLTIEEVDLTQLARDVADELSIVHGRGFTLELPARAYGYWSRDGLRRALENLVGNAVKYGQTGGEITVRLTQQHARTLLSVHNLGNPIPSEDQETLFNAYRRARSAEKSPAKGWGLGLALVRGVAEAHGGSVVLDSAPERGTTFTIDIPSDSRPFVTRVNLAQ